ncbi:hypothetical protein ACRALDRAFT_2041810 [Sodiomyces alcalophilus JCM 7366]|uniref:uncharacterized protein n=1 Tax=Sodiomyces alcalophilus JCM 7366 TaxID=591952 RepID=UPI0039B43BF3
MEGRAASEPAELAENAPRPSSTSAPDDAESGQPAMPPWVTVFILMGALGCLVLMFSVV